VGSAIVNGEHLDILVSAAAVDVFVLDPEVWEVNMVIEVRKVMLHRPGANLGLVAIGMPVVIVASTVVLMQPLLVVPLQLVVENDAVDTSALFMEAARCVDIRVKDL
jgi:hypothetical protein